MSTVDEQIRSAASTISSNIASLSHDRALLAQNILSQLRNLVEGVMVRLQTGRGDVEFQYAEYAAQVASCYLLLDRHRSSEQWLERSLQEQPDERCRDHATYLMWQAETALNLGDVDRACDVVGAALTDMIAARSTRNRARLARLNTRLQDHQTPATRDLDARLIDLLAS